jgi:hypothetical protein
VRLRRQFCCCLLTRLRVLDASPVFARHDPPLLSACFRPPPQDTSPCGYFPPPAFVHLLRRQFFRAATYFFAEAPLGFLQCACGLNCAPNRLFSFSPCRLAAFTAQAASQYSGTGAIPVVAGGVTPPPPPPQLLALPQLPHRTQRLTRGVPPVGGAPSRRTSTSRRCV